MDGLRSQAQQSAGRNPGGLVELDLSETEVAAVSKSPGRAYLVIAASQRRLAAGGGIASNVVKKNDRLLLALA